MLPFLNSGEHDNEIINGLGDMLRVTQAGKTRTYTPYIIAGRPTRLPGSETHPEFGTKRIKSYDSAGNPTEIIDFNGASKFQYFDSINQLIRVTGVAESHNNSATGGSELQLHIKRLAQERFQWR